MTSTPPGSDDVVKICAHRQRFCRRTGSPGKCTSMAQRGKNSSVSKLLLEDFYDFLELFRVTQLMVADGAEPVIEVQVAKKGMLMTVCAEIAAGILGKQVQRALSESRVAGE